MTDENHETPEYGVAKAARLPLPAMSLADYETRGRDLYGRYAEAVRGILLASLAQCPGIKHQEVQARAKGVASLAKKLGENAGTEDVQSAVKDLAGVRIVLYTDSDVDRLENQRLLSDNFDVDWDLTKIHYPVGKGMEASHFIGRNYAVRLTKARTTLPEYTDFDGLLCEVQVQTILQHAWSETAHDTIYKRPDLGDVGTRNVAALTKQMNRIQRDYLVPAGHEFQKVLSAFERLASGKELIDAGALQAIEAASDNNEACELIDQFRQYVLPEIDEPRVWGPDVRRAAIKAVRRASERPVKAAETPYGELPGKTLNDVAKRAAEMVNGPELRFVDPAATLDALIAMYAGACGDDEARDLFAKEAADLAKHHLGAWRHAGPFVQRLLMEWIVALDPQEAEAVRPLLLGVAGAVLGTEVEGTSSDSKSVTWTRGAVVVSDELHAVRDQAIELIEGAFLAASDDHERRRALGAYKKATDLPHVGAPSDDLVIRVRRDTARMIRFLADHAETLGNPLLQSAERTVHLRYRWSHDFDETAKTKPNIAEAGQEIADAVQAFRDRVDGLEDYGIFKVLVGFEAVFDEAWDAADFGTAHKLNEKARDEQAAALLAQVTVENAPQWFERLDRYAQTESNDLATFPRLGRFIADIVTTHPSLGPSWLDEAQGRAIGSFTPGMLRGLYDAKPEGAVSWAQAAIAEGKALSSVTHFLSRAEPPLPDLVVSAGDAAIEAKNSAAALSVLESAVRQMEALGQECAITIGLTMIEYLSQQSGDGWTDTLWLNSRDSGFLTSLDHDERSRLLSAMADLRQIDYRAEEILSVLAREHADEVVSMFSKRMEIECADESDFFDAERYEAIPFDFHRLHEVFGDVVAMAVLEAARGWSDTSVGLDEYRGGRFVANLYPDLSDKLIAGLIAFATSGDEVTQDFALAVSKNYNSAAGVWTVMKELVAVLEPGAPRLTDVIIALQTTGVTSGEYGHRDALTAQQRKLATWLEDEREPIRLFAESFMRSLDNQIAAETQRTERRIAQRRLDYGEPITSDDEDEGGDDGDGHAGEQDGDREGDE
jgi:ppGpp synthetase/RelA/SpoT-type nucleotidyltranferase